MSLPYPRKREGVTKLLTSIDERLLHCTEKFIELQVKQPTQKLISCHVTNYPKGSPEAEWFDIYSIYRSNQQLNESCNKLWASSELVHATKVKTQENHLLGEMFNANFLQGTLIPTLYYSQISALMSILSSFGFLFLLVNDRRYFLVRTQEGWKIKNKKRYVRDILQRRARGWHEQVIESYAGLRVKGIAIPRLAIKRTHMLRQLRNRMHYEILGDLRMWRMINGIKLFNRYLPMVIKTITIGINNLSKIKKITTGCNERFNNLIENLQKVDLS